jgi:light-regulated signal transduction histidine kinase (bacteriophytochrome)
LAILGGAVLGYTKTFFAKAPKEKHAYYTHNMDEGSLSLKIFDAKEHFIIECEHIASLDSRTNDTLQCGIDLLKPPFHAMELPKYYDLLVKGIFDITQYDRVMLYKFHEDWSGEVISEAKKEGFGSYLGLRFPASDIPSIAREMYLKNPFRHIADTYDVNVPILSLDASTPDLTYSDTRSVSPVHIEYMKNMGMRGSFSTPIVIFGELWGLVACHNAQPHYLSVEVRRMCRTLAHSFAIGISSFGTNEKLQKLDSADRYLNAMMEKVAESEDVLDGLEAIESSLMQILPCDGMAIVVDETLLCIGDVLPQESLEILDVWFSNTRQENNFSTDALMHSNLSKLIVSSSIAGILSTKTTTLKGTRIRCYWFRNELKQEIAWAGNPDKPVIENAGALKLSPRRSFERWIEVKSGYSKAWTGLDTLSAMKLNKTIYRWL